jgi:ATP-dependent RNA helicase MSS116, mitochondrial
MASQRIVHTPLAGTGVGGAEKFTHLAREGLVDAKLIATITDNMGYVDMTPVQAATIRPLLDGKDCLAKAKTGTGKTMAFLIPAIQNFLKKPAATNSTSVRLLVLSPTRELALQIANEARVLLANHPQLTVQTFIGGTNPR